MNPPPRRLPLLLLVSGLLVLLTLLVPAARAGGREGRAPRLTPKERARIEVPVDGRVRLALHAPASRVLPEVLAAEHVGVMRLPGHPAPRTQLRRVGAVPAADGRVVALYEGWRRTDVPAEARLLVPVAKGKPPQRLKVELSGEGLVELSK